MKLLVAEDVPLIPLQTTFRAHPSSDDLPNSQFYEGFLELAEARQPMLDKLQLPNRSVPFFFTDGSGTSVKAANGSHSNKAEANTCRELVTALLSNNIPPVPISIIAFYKEQFRLMEQSTSQHQVCLHTVDSV